MQLAVSALNDFSRHFNVESTWRVCTVVDTFFFRNGKYQRVFEALLFQRYFSVVPPKWPHGLSTISSLQTELGSSNCTTHSLLTKHHQYDYMTSQLVRLHQISPDFENTENVAWILWVFSKIFHRAVDHFSHWRGWRHEQIFKCKVVPT